MDATFQPPTGFRSVGDGEVFVSKDYVVVCGTPVDDENAPEELRHNCDAMGCGQDHVIFRARIS